MKIIRFSALWCMSCILMKSRWLQVLKTHPNLEVIDYDFDEHSKEVIKYQVGNILPVVIFVQNDIEVTRIIGEKSLKELNKILETMGL
ncbi:MAG: thioredoxin family protein [Candidatus Izemoplasmatales bacterium]|jgi:thiol-disulfide isomerase/thioredoxin|nr:thioredoxin family protein [Candidatus Izemoplasmatales bacterium]MDD3864728.1 thioredoxin family protein [Candidatus Izemoplasmatales bacterium]